MARVKLDEYTAKHLILPIFKLTYAGIRLSLKHPQLESKVNQFAHYPAVLKVDQGVKKRGKQGLVKLNVQANQVLPTLKDWHKLGFNQFLLEPLVNHSNQQELYLSLERTRLGWNFIFSQHGGVDIETHWDSINHQLIAFNSQAFSPTKNQVFNRLFKSIFPKLIKQLDALQIVFLEINPLIIDSNSLIPLDMAVKLDSTAIQLAQLNSPLPLTPIQEKDLSLAEIKVNQLDNSTPASLKFNLINPTGKIWMLLSGGGASLVLADEVADLKLGQELANYGEYSGDPSTQDTYSYTKIILQQLLKNNTSSRQAIVIAGGVANFTDVTKTFKGIIQALDEVKLKLKQLKVRVFVRRGGPNETVGLKMMQEFLNSADLLGSIYGHTTPLTQVILDVNNYLSVNPAK